MNVDELGPFENVLDVGGNVGEFAELCRDAWPAARITSFEPLPNIAKENRLRADGRWQVEPVALSSESGEGRIAFCTNQHTSSTMHEVGAVRRERFNIVDRWVPVAITRRRLDEYRDTLVAGRTLLKVDVEGHELEVLRGAVHVLELVDVAIVECNQEPDIFIGAPTPAELDAELRAARLYFAGVLGVQLDPAGDVVQFDGVWSHR